MYDRGLVCALVVWLTLTACDHEEALAPCDAGCGSAHVCLYARNVCVPVPDDAGNCPTGYRADPCGSSSCPSCANCIPACIPD